MLGLELARGTLVTGLLLGMTYGVLAVGLVLVFRATRVVNLAHAEVGAFGAALVARMVLDGGVPFAVALPVAVVVGALLGAAVDVVVVRRLATASRVVLLVATLGVAELLVVAQVLLPDPGDPSAAFPQPVDRVLVVGGVPLDGSAFLTLGLLPAAVLVLAVVLGRTPPGLAVRAAADNADAAELAGISTRRVSTAVWAVSGGLSVLTVVLADGLLRTQVGLVDTGFGPGLLLRALTAALVGRLVSLPLALAGGIGVGVVDAVLQVSYPGRTGYVDAFLLLAVLALVLRQAVRERRQIDVETGPLVALQVPRPLPPALQGTWWAEHLGALTWSVLGVLALGVPFLGLDAGQLAAVSRVPLMAVVGLSLVVLTGWAGLLSLGQVAFYGLGAVTAAALVQRGVPFPAAVAEATIAGVLVALLVGLPALLVRGLYLAVTTLAFAVAAGSALFQARAVVGPSKVLVLDPGSPLGVDLRDGRVFYYLCLGALVLSALAVRGLRRSGVGRSLLAVSANAPRAAALTVSPVAARLTAFAVSGGLAAFAGALLAGLQRSVSYQQFPVSASLTAVALVMIGGLGTVSGAVLGAAYVLGLPALFGGGTVATLLPSGVGLLVLLLYVPGGLQSVVLRVRDLLLDAVARRRPPVVPAARVPVSLAPRTPPVLDGPAFEVRGATVRFGGRTAVDGVDLHVDGGEVLGLIGPNGAGKSTLLAAGSGFVRLDEGSVRLLGADVTALAPHERARLGLGRVFQDARLFDDLTARECVLVALEAVERAEVVPSLLGLPPARAMERRKRAAADEVVDALGLGDHADLPVRTLSTGTRRVVELACLVAQRPRVLLLDEPTAGLAQREVEAFAPVLGTVRQALGAPMVVVEHDLPLVLELSDRVQCLAEGRTLAVGTPDAVAADPLVVARYLGTDEALVRRSGARAKGRRPRKTVSGA